MQKKGGGVRVEGAANSSTAKREMERAERRGRSGWRSVFNSVHNVQYDTTYPI